MYSGFTKLFMALLTNGVLATIMKGNDCPAHSIIQVLKISSNQEDTTVILKANQLKYKCLVTDGKTFCTAILPAQFNSAIQKEEIKEFTVVKLSHGHLAYVNGTRFVVLAGLSVVKHFDRQMCELHIESDGYNSKKVASLKRKLESNQNVTSNSIVTPNKVGRGDRSESEQKGKVTPPVTLWKEPTKQDCFPHAYEIKEENCSSYELAVTEAEQCLKGLHLRVTPVSALSIFSNKFYIITRVTYKSDLVKWNKTGTEGMLFHIHLLDQDGGQIKGTFYNLACAQFFDVIHKGKVYMMSNMTVKHADSKQISSLNNQFELTFSTSALIVPTADNGSIKEQQLSLVKIDRIPDCAVNSVIDVIGIVRVVGELTTVKNAKTDLEYIKRDLTLVDDSNCEIKVTVWGNDTEQSKYNWSEHLIMCIQGAVVKHFTGCSLSLTPGSIITVDPSLPEADALRVYREQFPDGVVPAANSLSTNIGQFGALEESTLIDRKEIEYLKSPMLCLSVGETGAFVTVKATVTGIKRQTDIWYHGCPQPNCGRKVIKDENSQLLRCPKCKTSCEKFQCCLRFILYVIFSDHTGSQEFSLHNEMAELLLGGVSAQQLSALKGNNLAGYDGVFDDALFQTWLCKLKLQVYENKLKCTVVGLASSKMDWECSQIESVLKF